MRICHGQILKEEQMLKIVYRFRDGFPVMLALLLFGSLPSTANGVSSTIGFPVVPQSWKYCLQGVDYSISNWARGLLSWMAMNPSGDLNVLLVRHDGDGQQLEGARRYRLHFSAEQLPPAEVLWWITINPKESFLADDQRNRYQLSSWDPLQYKADGSLDLYIQSHSPGRQLENNWLLIPAKGGFEVSVTRYFYRDTVLDASWKLPMIRKMD